MVERTDDGQTTTVQYTPESLKQEHNSAKSTLDKIINGIFNANGKEPTAESIKNIGKKDEKLEQSGIDTENIPDILKKPYIKMINFVYSPEKRFKNQKEEVENLANGLEGIKIELTEILYGAGYNGSSGKLNGLSKEYHQLAKRRFDCAKALKSLEEEINGTSQRIEKTKEILKERLVAKDYDKMEQINTDMIGFKFDLTRYEDIKKELQGELEGVNYAVTSVNYDIKAAECLRDYVRDQGQKARNELKIYRSTGRELNHTKLIADFIPKLQEQLNKYRDMGKDFREHNNNQMKEIVDLTTQQVQVGEPNEQLSDPFENYHKNNEERSDKISELTQKILENPYEDIYKN